MKLYDSGVYLVNGKEIMTDATEVQQKTGKAVTKEQAAENTIAYGILKKHNTSGNMDKLQVRFDKLTSHDITFVGIIQILRSWLRSLLTSLLQTDGSLPDAVEHKLHRIFLHR